MRGVMVKTAVITTVVIFEEWLRLTAGSAVAFAAVLPLMPLVLKKICGGE